MYITIGILILAIVTILVYRFLGDRLGYIDLRQRGVLYCRPPILRVKSVMMMTVSLIVLVSALYVILSQQYDDGTQKWAFGAVGSIIGFWLKSEEE